MPLQSQQRARTFLFTISLAGEGSEHKLLGASGIRRVIEEVSHTESTRLDTISLAGHWNVDNIVVREAPFVGCIQEAGPNFLFEVDVDSSPLARLRRVSGLSVTWEIIDNRESDQLATQKLWGKRSYGEVTLETTNDWQDKWQLYRAVARRMGEFVGPGPQFARVDNVNCPYTFDVTITARTQNGTPIAKWVLHKAWPSTWSINDLAADSNEVGIESITWRLANLPGSVGIEEVLGRRFEMGHMVSSGWYDFVSRSFRLPESRDLILSIYHPGSTPGRDAPAGRLKLFNAWVSEISYGDLDASANEVLTREVTLAYEGIRPF